MIPYGYFAVSRGVFDHPIFRNRPHWLVAWQWLIAKAAWKPMGMRGHWGVVHVERGELCTSIRTLADSWGWSKSNVETLLNRLEREEMIELYKSRTATRTPDGTPLPYPVTIIGICKYDKFQKPSTGAKSKFGQEVGHEVGQRSQQAFPVVEEIIIEPLNHLNQTQQQGKVEEQVGDRRRTGSTKPPPRHGQVSQKHGSIYLQAGTPEWDVYAEDFEAVRFAAPLPDRHGGYWFKVNGEATRRPNDFPCRTRKRA